MCNSGADCRDRRVLGGGPVRVGSEKWDAGKR